MKHYRGIPQFVRVGNYQFEVRVIDQDAADAGGFFGVTSPTDQLILIGDGQTAQCLADTFIHEVLHAICWLARIGFANKDKNNDEEDFVTHIAQGLCRFWQDNPEAAKWWARVNASQPVRELA